MKKVHLEQEGKLPHFKMKYFFQGFASPCDKTERKQPAHPNADGGDMQDAAWVPKKVTFFNLGNLVTRLGHLSFVPSGSDPVGAAKEQQDQESQ